MLTFEQSSGKMIFSIGTRVLLKNTGDKGSIDHLLDDEMVVVKLDDGGMLIPVFPEDLQRLEASTPGKQPIKAKVVPGKKDRTPQKPEVPVPQFQYTILKSFGIQLGFEPIRRPDGTTRSYSIHLINDTRTDAVFNLKISFLEEDEPFLDVNGSLKAMSAELLGELPFDRLNDSPKVEAECWEASTAGTGGRHSKTLRIKAKQFFKKLKSAPLLNKDVHHYILFENLAVEEKPDEAQENLRDYTRRNKRTADRSSSNGYFSHIADPTERANFSTEIDLHIEQLNPSRRKLTNAEKLRIQLNAFDDYLAKAIRLGVSKVFIIHGVGKGRLRDEIASRLLQNPDVVSFRNEYHPAYGYGATEVLL